MEVNLIVSSGKNAGQKIPVSGPKFFIGRAKDCQLRPRSDLISRHHCVILVEESYVALRDFGSKNGTLVNGERVKTEQELKTGDVLQIGQLMFQVELAISVGGKKKPKVRSIQEAALRTTQSTRSQDDLDVDSWLQDDDDLTDSARKEDTQTIDSTKADAAEEAAQKQPKKEEAQPAPSQQAPAPSQQAPDPSEPADSRDAATDMLKNFFKRR